MGKNNKTRCFYVLYSDKTLLSDQSERAYYPIYIIIYNIFIFLSNLPKHSISTAMSIVVKK